MDANSAPTPPPIDLNVVSPPDILRRILALASSCYGHPGRCHALPSGTGHTITSVAHNLCSNTPDHLLLSHVCSRWRKLILHTPTMWASIFISSPTDQQLHLLKLWLERSQSCALNISFDYCSDTGHGSFKPIVKLLVGGTARCVSFEFMSLVQRNMPGTFGEYILPGSFNALKTLRSSFVGMDDTTFLDDFAVTFFGPGSNLRVCKLIEPQALSTLPRINPIWSQKLTNLSLFVFGGDLSILPMISNSPELVSLTLGFSFCEADPAQSVMVTLPKLRYLILRHLQASTRGTHQQMPGRHVGGGGVDRSLNIFF